MPKNAKIFHCELCDFNANKLSNWNTHLSTRKHRVNHDNQQKQLIVNKKMPFDYPCNICNKIYKERSGLWRHQQKYIDHKNKQEINTESSTINNKNTLISENLLLKVIEQNQQIIAQTNEFTPLKI